MNIQAVKGCFFYKWSELSNANVWQSTPTTTNEWNPSRYFTTFTGKYGNTYNTSYYFRILDGFSVAFLYNPYCVNDTKEHYTYFETISNNKYYMQQSLDVVCFNAIYDMNGKKGPNKVGYDIGFIGSLYNGFETKTAAVLPHGTEKMYNASGLTGSTSWDKLYNYCDKLSKDKEWIMPDVDEMSLIYVNYRLVANAKYVEGWFFSRTPWGGAPGYFRRVYFGSDGGGSRLWNARSYTSGLGPNVRCVRRKAGCFKNSLHIVISLKFFVVFTFRHTDEVSRVIP